MENEQLTEPSIEEDKYVKKVRALIEKARIEGRYPYVMPINKLDTAALTLKTVCVGRGLGVQIPRDVVLALNIRKAQMINIVITTPSQKENPIKQS